MTKLEALAKDCIENHTHRLIDKPSKQDIYTREESIYISGYKECERQNKNKIEQLEAQIKDMRCCGNCRHDIDEDSVIVKTDYCDKCFEFCNWELRK